MRRASCLVTAAYHPVDLICRFFSVYFEEEWIGCQHDLTRGPITRTMLLFAGPMIAGNLLQQFYNVADTLIVGQFLGAQALAAVGIVLHADDLSDLHPAGAVHGQRGGVLHPVWGSGTMEELKAGMFRLLCADRRCVTLVLNAAGLSADRTP